MKTYNITVNGKAYTVGVEEIAQGAPSAVPVYAPAPAPVAAPAPAPAPVPAPAPAPVAAPAPVQGGTVVTCPMPGTILDMNVKPGDSVKAGDVLLILEAMKMENEIAAPYDGVVSQVCVAKGASVNTGDTLVVL